MSVFGGLVRRELRLAWRRRSESINPLMFALIVTTLFPLALGPESAKLARIASGVSFVTVLLAALLTLDGLFRGDAEDGSLDQYLAGRRSPSQLAAAKMLCHWLSTGLPLTVVAPGLALLLGLDSEVLPVLIAALFLSTLLISIIGACLAALTVGARRSGILLALLVLPLNVPVLIFGAGAVEAAINHGPVTAPLLFLAAGLAVVLPVAPVVCGQALKMAVE